MPPPLPSSLFHVVGRSDGPCRFDRYSVSLYEGSDQAEALGAYRDAIPIAKRAHAATVTVYRLDGAGRLRVLPGCRFDGKAWRESRQPAGAAVGLGGAP